MKKPASVALVAKPKRIGRGVRLNPVPPSSRAGMRRGPTRNAIERAADLYERFSGHDAGELGTVKIPDPPAVGVVIGEVDGIMYRTVRDGVMEKYIHKFHPGDSPLFIVDPTGKMIYLIGGNYRFTERGIVDRSDK